MKAKILEIFKSLQGEGKYIGIPQVFVRFFECHMHCAWCDTPDSIGDGKREFSEYSPEELLEEIKPFVSGCHSVSLTGGEPLLQADFIKEFIPYIREAGLGVYLETSGVLYKELNKIIDDVDIIAMDIKLPSSTRCRAFWQEHEEFLKISLPREVFIKAVISSTTTQEDMMRAVDIVARINPQTLFILQPNFFEMENGVVQKCRELYTHCSRRLPHVRILPQVHKMMRMP